MDCVQHLAGNAGQMIEQLVYACTHPHSLTLALPDDNSVISTRDTQVTNGVFRQDKTTLRIELVVSDTFLIRFAVWLNHGASLWPFDVTETSIRRERTAFQLDYQGVYCIDA